MLRPLGAFAKSWGTSRSGLWHVTHDSGTIHDFSLHTTMLGWLGGYCLLSVREVYAIRALHQKVRDERGNMGPSYGLESECRRCIHLRLQPVFPINMDDGA
nr:hypothetical protein L204_00043 [Cryptococcus depauperatus CBS 7855]